MLAKNSFNFIGLCYGNAKVIYTKGSKKIGTVTLVIGDSYNHLNKNYIPIVAYGANVDLILNRCRNGNVVAVAGEVKSKNTFDRETGDVTVQIFFFVQEIMLIRKAKQKELTDAEINTIIANYGLNDINPLDLTGRRKKNG